jgi:protein tyrosine phosphatase
MVWEQDVRVIVMLTAEEEGGRLKSHNYWETDHYGPLKLTRIQERKVSLEPASLKTSPKRRSVSTTGQSSSADSSIPYIIVRTFTLEHAGLPFAPIREITQLQYSAWPDLGTPAHPSHVLGLVEHTDAVVRASTSSEAAASRRPVLVHCSAGCGRTGTFCTVDSVISMLKQQRMKRKRQMQQQLPDNDGSDGDGDMKMKQLGLEDEGDWINRDEDDLVFKAVSELRDQRISMVQCLQQYVLCYETVLEWLAKQGPLDSGKRKA